MISSISQRVLYRSASLVNSARSSFRHALVTESRTQMLTRTNARVFASKADAPNVVAEVKPGVAGEVPSILDQATGLERAEIDHPDLFKHNEVLRGAFGTKENPVMIQSNYDSRIVGCTGKASPDDHDIVWLNVEKGEQAVCGVCGQVFELDPL